MPNVPLPPQITTSPSFDGCNPNASALVEEMKHRPAASMESKRMPMSERSTISFTSAIRAEDQLHKDRSYSYSGSVDDSSQTLSTTTPVHANTNEIDDDSLESTSARKQRFFRGKPVKPKDQHLPEHVLEFKQRRKLRTIASTWTGGMIGFISAGPLGAAVGATAAYGIAKGVGKAKERRLVKSSWGPVKPNETAGINRALYESPIV